MMGPCLRKSALQHMMLETASGKGWASDEFESRVEGREEEVLSFNQNFFRHNTFSINMGGRQQQLATPASPQTVNPVCPSVAEL